MISEIIFTVRVMSQSCFEILFMRIQSYSFKCILTNGVARSVGTRYAAVNYYYQQNSRKIV